MSNKFKSTSMKHAGSVLFCLSNEVGKSQESDLEGLFSGDVTPGIPDKLECTAEARNVKLSWNVPKLNGSAAKYYEIFIYKQSL